MRYLSTTLFKTSLLLAVFMTTASVQAMPNSAFSTRPTEEFLKMYGEAANKKFQEIVPSTVQEISRFIAKEAKNPDQAQIEKLVDFIGKKTSMDCSAHKQ